MAGDSTTVHDSLRKMLRVLLVIHERSRDDVCEMVGISPATVTRYLNTLRQFGVKVKTVGPTRFAVYQVSDYGPFDPEAVRRVVRRA